VYGRCAPVAMQLRGAWHDLRPVPHPSWNLAGE
jgi:hypothetical protein